jgi:hypothetical protein
MLPAKRVEAIVSPLQAAGCRKQRRVLGCPPASFAEPVSKTYRVQLDGDWTGNIFLVQITWLGKVCGVVANPDTGRALFALDRGSHRSALLPYILVAVSDPSSAQRQNLGSHFAVVSCACIYCNQTNKALQERREKI